MTKYWGPALQKDFAKRCEVWSDIVDWLPTLYETVLQYKNPTILELGVRSGNSTAAFLAAADEVDGVVWSVDIHPPNVPTWWLDTTRWKLRVDDDLNPALMVDLPAEVDVLFIDTSHHYEQTLAELRAYVPRVKPGGVVLMHDVELEMPDGYVGDPYPVRRAIEDYCTDAGIKYELRSGCYGLGVIQR